MHSAEYQRLSAACRAMAAQSSDHLPDVIRWSKLAECSSNLANERSDTRDAFRNSRLLGRQHFEPSERRVGRAPSAGDRRDDARYRRARMSIEGTQVD